jgi:hypothetical protein
VALLGDGKGKKPRGESTLRLFEARTGKQLCCLPGFTSNYLLGDADGGGHFQPVFSPDGTVVAAASAAGRQVALLEAATGKELSRLGTDQFMPRALRFSPDGRLLVVMDRAQKLCLVGTTTGKVLRRLESEPVGEFGTCAVFSPDGRFLAAAYPDRTARLWEVATGKEVVRWRIRDGDIQRLEFAPDGRKLAAVVWDGTALVWDVTGRVRDGGLPPLRLQVASLEAAWADLSSPDAATGQQARWRLLAAADQAVPLLRERLKPAAPIDPQRVGRLIAGLRSEHFETRQKAADELEELAEMTEAALRKELAGQTALDFRRRVERLLAMLDEPLHDAGRLRAVRSVAVLESIGSAESKHVLTQLADGAPEALLTREAKAALGRLNAQPTGR